MKMHWRSLLVPALGLGLALSSACSTGAGAPNPPADMEASALSAETQSAEPLPVIELVSRGGVGRNYTLNEREARAAVADRDMTRTSAQLGSMSPRQVEGTGPAFRLKPSRNSNRWLVTSSTHERDTLASRGWVYEGIVGYVYIEPGSGRQELSRFTNGHEWRLSLESQIDGYVRDGTVGYVDVNP
jgi:hypothetical protein